MKFKDFSWPVNPKTWSEEAIREPQYEKDYQNNQVFQGLGPLKRVIVAEGAFFGPDAHLQYGFLAALLEQPEAGTLTHPHWGERQAFFTGLQMTQEPRENYVAYRCEFRQADGNGHIPH